MCHPAVTPLTSSAFPSACPKGEGSGTPAAGGAEAPAGKSAAREDRRRAAFEAGMMTHLDALYRAAISMTRSPGDAEDLVQDTYLRAWQFYEQFTEGTNARAWLFRILTNLYINRFRQRARQPERVSYDEVEDFYLYNRLSDIRRGQGGELSPEEAILQKVQAEAIRAAIDQLPEEYRETVILADLNDFSYQEISEIQQIPIGTVRSRLSRGRRLVQKALWAYTEENTR